jgi:hypothetical protein
MPIQYNNLCPLNESRLITSFFLKVKRARHLESIVNPYLREVKPNELDKEKLASKMRVLLKINEQTSEANLLPLEIYEWKKGAVLYEDNEIVNYSLARLLKSKILGEKLELSQIANLEVIPEGKDLKFQITLKSNT